MLLLGSCLAILGDLLAIAQGSWGAIYRRSGSRGSCVGILFIFDIQGDLGVLCSYNARVTRILDIRAKQGCRGSPSSAICIDFTHKGAAPPSSGIRQLRSSGTKLVSLSLDFLSLSCWGGRS